MSTISDLKKSLPWMLKYVAAEAECAWWRMSSRYWMNEAHTRQKTISELEVKLDQATEAFKAVRPSESLARLEADDARAALGLAKMTARKWEERALAAEQGERRLREILREAGACQGLAASTCWELAHG